MPLLTKIKKFVYCLLVISVFVTVYSYVQVKGFGNPVQWYVRDGGGGIYGLSQATNTCNGQSNVVYSFGVSPNCAVNHPNLILGYNTDNPQPQRINSGDTLFILGDSDISPGSQAQYKIGYDSTGGTTPSCSSGASFNCTLLVLPSGTNSSNRTQVVGTGTHQPQLWGTNKVNFVLDAHTNYTHISNIEMTSHSDCGYNFGVNGCLTVAPYGPFARDGLFVSGTGSLYENLYIHNMKAYGIYAFGMANNTFNNTWLIGNQQGGFASDPLVSMSGILTWNNTIVEWNGCQEKYPLPNAGINNPLNYMNCTAQDGSNGSGANPVIADGIAFGNDTNGATGSWVFLGGSVSFNTQDGIDLLHGNGSGSLQIDKMKLEGNAGAAFKGGNPIMTVTNSLILADCGWWHGAAQSTPNGMGTGGSGVCRAGTAIAINGSIANGSFTALNNTIMGNFYEAIEAAGNSVSSYSMNLYNNIALGGYAYIDDTSFNSAGGNAQMALYNIDAGTLTVNKDYNVCFNLKNNNTVCNDTHDIRSSPGFSLGLPPMGTAGGGAGTYYQGTALTTYAPLGISSPAIGAGTNGKIYWYNSNDYYNNSRPITGQTNYTIGGEEPGSLAANGYMCFFNSDCAGGSCTNNYCGGSCNTNGTSCSDGLGCCSFFCTSNLCASCIDNGSSSSSATACCSGLLESGVCVSCLTNGTSASNATQCCSGLLNGGQCVSYICGDGLMPETGKTCDVTGPNLYGATCQTQGFLYGILGCNAGCLSFNTSGCTNTFNGPTIVQSVKFSPSAVQNTVPLTLTSTPTPGNLMVAYVSYSQYQITRTLTPPSGWTLLDSNSNTLSDSLSTYYRVVQLGDPKTYTWSISGASNDWESGVIYEITNENSSLPFNGNAILNSASASSVTTPTITPTASNTLALTGITTDQGSAASVSVSSVSPGFGLDQSAIPQHHTTFASSFNVTTGLLPLSNKFTLAASSNGSVQEIMLINPSGSCTNNGGACSTGSTCCSTLCQSSLCVSCLLNGGSCSINSNCCSNNCSAGTCATAPVGAGNKNISGMCTITGQFNIQ